MAELGSHQLDAASIFIAAMHDGKKQIPLSVAAAADRPLFPPDRDVEDHVYCLIEFPAPGYDAKDPFASRKKIGVQYASINGNGFGGYGEIVFGTKGTLILEQEQERCRSSRDRVGTEQHQGFQGRGRRPDARHPGQRHGGSGRRQERRGKGQPRLHRGVGALGVVHPSSRPREPAALRSEGGDGRRRDCPDHQHGRPQGARIEFKKEWFDIHSDETPENVALRVVRCRVRNAP